MKTCSAAALILCVPLLIINLSCSSVNYKTINPGLNDGKYDSEFPYRNASAQLEAISNSLYRINSLAFYKVYSFDQYSNLKLKDLNDETIRTKSVKTSYKDHASSGTGIVIYSMAGRVGLLTCQHVIDFKDTIVTYFANENGVYTDEVQSLGFKTKEFIYAAGFPEGSEVNEIISDKENDITLLGKNYPMQFSNYFTLFTYPFGEAKELEWGSFVYALGFPLNYKMITQAIVSSPNYDHKGSFFINAVVNRGYSGGPVLAIRDGVPNFELVGIIEWVPEESENIIVPSAIDQSLKYNPMVPYHGDLFVQQQKLLRYGIAKVIPIEEIKQFLIRNKDVLLSQGYYFKIFDAN